MKNLKTTILSVCIALCCLTNGNAQENARKNRGKIMMAGSPGTILVFGGGTSMPSSDGKDKAFLSNSTAINADAFFSLISKPEANFSFGLNFGGAYNFGGSGGFGTTPNPFAVTGQTSSMVSDRGTDPAQATFRMGAGPQANFYFGKFIVSPMVLGEYFSMTQKEMSIVQTTQFNGQSYDFNLATLPETKTSGFAATPKLRLHYMFNDRFGLFADASYTMGPKIETTVSKLIPNGVANTPGNDYDLQALQTGTMVKGETKSTAYSAMGFNFGVVIGLGRNGSKGWNGVAETVDGDGTKATGGTPTGKTNTDDIRKGWNGKIENENDKKNLVLRYSHWWNHWQGINCGGAGIYCINPLRTVGQNLDANETVGNTEITLTDNDIVITTIGENGNVSKEILGKFSAKNVQLFDNELPKDIAQKLFTKIDLNLPKEKIVLKASDQKYQVIDGINGNQIIEAEEKAKINIDGKTYNLTVITTSGVADNSNNRSYISNCCGPLVTGGVSWIDPATSVLTSLPVPSGTLGTVSMASMGSGLVFNSCITCNPYLGCAGTIKYKVWNYATSSYSYTSSTVGTLCTNFTIPSSAFPTAGSYTIEVVGKCGGMECKKAKYQITITGCCSGGSWGVQQFKYYTTRPYVAIPSTILTAEGAALYFDINYNCGTTSCAAILDYEFYDNTSTLISTTSNPSGVLLAGLIVPHGAILLKVKAKCAGQVCSTIMYKIQTATCCIGSNWTRQDIASDPSGVYTTYSPFTTGAYDATPIICATTFPNTNPVDFTFAIGSYPIFNFDHTAPTGCSPCNVTYQLFDSSMIGGYNGTGYCGVPFTLRMPTYSGVFYLRITIMNGSIFCSTRTFKITTI